MYMDMMMNTVFYPGDYAMPFTVTIEDVEANLDLVSYKGSLVHAAMLAQ